MKYSLIILLTILLTSCTKDKDDESINYCADEKIGIFPLIKESRNSIPYKYYTILTFKDSSGTEVTLNFNPDVHGLVSSFGSHYEKCISDSTKNKRYRTESNSYLYELNEESNHLDFNIRITLGKLIHAHYDTVTLARDDLNIKFRRKSDSTFISGGLTIVVDQSIPPNSYVPGSKPMPISSVQLLDKSFNDVYTNYDSSIFYNYVDGLVAFRDLKDNLWVFTEAIMAVP